MYVILGEVFQVFPIKLVSISPCPPGDDIEKSRHEIRKK